jgi:hypothetical protein
LLLEMHDDEGTAAETVQEMIEEKWKECCV